MPVLYQHEVIRKPGYLTNPEIEKLSFRTHSENQETENLKNWSKQGKESYTKMIEAMNLYLDSDKAINSLEQFPEYLKPCIEYTINNPDTFNTKGFVDAANFERLKKEITVRRDGKLSSRSIISRLLNACADTILARHKTNNFKNQKFDEKLAFKSLTFLKETMQIDKDKLSRINGLEFIKRPVLVYAEIIADFDPCEFSPLNVPINDSQVEIEKPRNCPCDSLKAKERACDCEETNTDPCECKCNDECHDTSTCCANIETYVAELFVVKDEVSRYKPGDISDIENVMMGETRVKKHRHLQREETYTETEEENNTFSERNNQIDERASLHKEIDKVIETDLSVDAGANYSSRAGNKKTYKSFNASSDVSFNQSKKNAQKTVQDHSKEVLSSALDRVEKKVRTLNSRRMINEIEEKNKHTFDGTGYTEHENGIYFFVNQERKAQVYSHGVRGMLDFNIPDPSKRLKALLEKKFQKLKPKKPCLDIKDINPDDYLKYIQCYGFTELEKPNPEKKTIKLFVKGDNPIVYKDDDQFTTNETQDFAVPDGYKATSMEIVGFNSTHHEEDNWSKVFLRIDTGSVFIEHNDGHSWSVANNTVETATLNNLEGTNTLSITNWNTTTYNITLVIHCERKSENKEQWQLDVYNRIMEKYNKELEEYNQAFEEFKRNKQNKFNQNPFMLSETIKEQLKHSALEYITCQFFDAKNGMRNKVKPCGLPQMDIRETEEFGERVRFFEHAFEWKFMSYMLYPYFWSEKCSWDDKLQEEAQNGLFQKFLQSGYARVSLSIRPGFEADIEYFLEEGEIWSGAGLPTYGDPNYLPIHQEIKESKDNFNADRDGYLIWDSTLGLARNEIVLRNDPNPDPVEYFEPPTIGSPPAPNPNIGQLDPLKVEADIDRVIVIECIEYRIVNIELRNGEVILILDRDLEHKDPVACPDDFVDRYEDKRKLWSTGAKFVGAPWAFTVPTSLTWLKEDECLPSYPVTCKDNC
jgi:hypothetical protein